MKKLQGIIFCMTLSFLTECENKPEANKPGTAQDLQAKMSVDTLKQKHDSVIIPRSDSPLPASGFKGNTSDAFQKIHSAFEGMPEIETVKPLLEAVMVKYGTLISNQSVLRSANVLIALKKQSKTGVTEMDILTHMYQYPIKKDFADQAALSASLLEKSK